MCSTHTRPDFHDVFTIIVFVTLFLLVCNYIKSLTEWIEVVHENMNELMFSYLQVAI